MTLPQLTAAYAPPLPGSQEDCLNKAMWTSELVASVLSPDTLAAWSRGLQSRCPAPTSLGAECEEGHRWQGALLWFSYMAGAHTQQWSQPGLLKAVPPCCLAQHLSSVSLSLYS